MADTSSNRAPAAAPIAEDDPFAELTRIMGFDPRVKVHQPQPTEPDFGLDLERELLGEFSGDQDNFPAIPVQSAPTAVAPQAVAPIEAPAEPLYDNASASAIEAHPADDFHDTVDTFVADAPEPAVAEPDVDPFADFELSFDEDETISTDDVLGRSPQPHVGASSPVAEPVQPAAEEDDEIEAAYAALEAWQNNREQQAQASVQSAATEDEQPAVMQDRAEAVDLDEPIEMEQEQAASTDATDPLDLQLLEELAEIREEEQADSVVAFEIEAAPAPAPSESDADLIEDLDLDTWSETAPETPVQQDVFTAEDGWLDEGSVSLDEPQVLSQHQADAPSERAPVATAPDARDQWELVEAAPEQAHQATPAHDAEFERELFDLLGGEMESEQQAQASVAPEDDSWLEGIDFAEAEAPTTPETASTNGEDDALWHLDLSEVDTAPAVAVAAASFAPIATAPEQQQADQKADAEPDLGEFELADLLADDAASLEVEAASEAERSDALHANDFAAARPTAVQAEPISYPQHEALTAAPDPAAQPAQPDMEPDAMQPFDERAFDAALADELAADPYGRDDDRGARYAQPAASHHGYAAQPRARVNAPSMQSEVPNIETVDFVDQRLAHSDDLDLPEVDYGREPAPRANGFDDFDSEFNSSYHSLNDEPARQPGRNEPEAPRQASTQNWDEHLDFSMGGAAAGVAAGAPAGQYGSSLSRAGMYEPEEEDGYYEQPARSRSRTGILGRRGMLMAGAAAAILLVGGVAMLAMPSGTVGNGEPTLVRADSDPMKVRPENPGGTTVPNQDNVVYDRVGSGQPLGAPTQERLISKDEAPVDLSAQESEEDSLAGLSALDSEGTDPEGADVGDVDEEAVGTSAKAEDRLTADTAGTNQSVPEEVVAVAPRRVRTMVVRPDGSLAPREEEAATPAPQLASAAQAVTAEPAAVTPAAAPSLPETVESAIDETPAAEPEPAPAPRVAAVQPAAQRSAAPQAVDAAAAPSGWAVQIASQPTEAAAQTSYDNLSRRYASVLNGKGVSIVKADIAGKGTYYRVRIPASSRAEANTICTNYKGAGGSCFVSQ